LPLKLLTIIVVEHQRPGVFVPRQRLSNPNIAIAGIQISSDRTMPNSVRRDRDFSKVSVVLEDAEDIAAS
jgi:hypothetical protein